mgnify:CR=1 FL=1
MTSGGVPSRSVIPAPPPTVVLPSVLSPGAPDAADAPEAAPGVAGTVGDVAQVRIGSLTRYGTVTQDGREEAVQGLVLGLRGANAQQVVEFLAGQTRCGDILAVCRQRCGVALGPSAVFQLIEHPGEQKLGVRREIDLLLVRLEAIQKVLVDR